MDLFHRLAADGKLDRLAVARADVRAGFVLVVFRSRVQVLLSSGQVGEAGEGVVWLAFETGVPGASGQGYKSKR